MAWDIMMEKEEDPEDPERPNNFTRPLVLAQKVYKDYKQQKLQAVAIIYGSCTNAVKVYIKGIEDPVQMWKELEPCTNTANSSVGRMSLFRKFNTLRPTPRQPLNAYFAELLDIITELAGSEEAVSNMVLKNHIDTTLPPAYVVTIEILQSRARVTVQEIIVTNLARQAPRRRRGRRAHPCHTMANPCLRRHGHRHPTRLGATSPPLPISRR